MKNAAEIMSATLDEHPGFEEAFEAHPGIVTKVFMTGMLCAIQELAHEDSFSLEGLVKCMQLTTSVEDFIAKMRTCHNG